MARDLYKRALGLAYFTVFYNVVEGTVSVLAGSLAGSIALVGFGLDSFIESLSGCVLVWRLRKHGRTSADQEERIEARAVRLVGITFFILAADVGYESAKKLVLREAAAPSLLGIIIAAVSIAVMTPLFYAKYHTGRALGSRSVVADSRETLACMFLSVVLLLGVGANYLFAAWWADPLAGLVIALYLAREGWETIRGDED